VALDQKEQVPEESIETSQPEMATETKLTMRLRKSDGTIREMDMDTYLVGVVAGEMPASFAPEALKAQAVVARTFTLRAFTTGGKHGDGSVCTDSTCCQAYREDLQGESLQKITTAVLETSGQVLLYEGNLIEATYFSCSGGSTEDAVAVWGTDYPYLRATVSPGEEHATHYTDTVYFTKEEFTKVFGGLSGDAKHWIGYATYTAGGGVHSILIGGKEYKGTQIRTMLGLRSTAFTMTVEGERIKVTTKGYGHRVGMSQYGADAMAMNGCTYPEILAYYYQGTELIVWTEN
jgi:stage II sporulation protein D